MSKAKALVFGLGLAMAALLAIGWKRSRTQQKTEGFEYE